MTEELKQKAENYIIDRYKLNECYREDNEETCEYMRMDVHSQYEEEYQLYLAGATEATKELQEENLKLEAKVRTLEIEQHYCLPNCSKVTELEKKIERMKNRCNCVYGYYPILELGITDYGCKLNINKCEGCNKWKLIND